ncbi:MAG: hypothetical protein ACLQU4_05765 [Limisphaerales bacterium]
MKLRGFFTVSLVCNLALAITLVAVRKGSPASANAPSPAASLPVAAEALKPFGTAATQTPVMVPWRLIESADYRQYIANLRTVSCPEWLVRDIIVADIDDLYDQKSRTDPVYYAPWKGTDQRQMAVRSRSAKLNVLRQEKRALVKYLLGYEWENYAEQVWKQDLLTSLTLGFLPDDKAAQVVSLRKQYAEAAQNIREAANFILIDDDRARLQSLYEGSEADLSQLLDASAFDELQLRAQQSVLPAYDIHFDGVTVRREELREIVQWSKSFKDMARDEFVSDRPLSDAELAGRKAAFEAQVKALLGLKRFADYQRAQDFNFREAFEFTQQNQLPQAAAIGVYEASRNAAAQLSEIQNDGNLSSEERAELLAVLKAVTMNTISSALGGNYQNYLAGPGQWLNALVQQPEPQTEKETQ